MQLNKPLALLRPSTCISVAVKLYTSDCPRTSKAVMDLSHSLQVCVSLLPIVIGEFGTL